MHLRPAPRRAALLGLAAALGLVAAAAACGDGGAAGGAASPDRTEAASDLEGSIVVFAAASLTDAFDEIVVAFEQAHPGVSVASNFGASSSLREQILGGAPADVFASANTSNMDQVVEAGEVEDEPVIFARNRLQIVVPAGNPADVTGLEDFADPDLLIGQCAEEVPCGDFARAALALAAVTPAIDTNEPDVRSLLTKVSSGDLDAGIVYRTDVLAAGATVEGIEIPPDQNVVADYPMAALARSGRAALARAFMAFVLSEDGQGILASHGFDPV